MPVNIMRTMGRAFSRLGLNNQKQQDYERHIETPMDRDITRLTKKGFADINNGEKTGDENGCDDRIEQIQKDVSESQMTPHADCAQPCFQEICHFCLRTYILHQP